jgi:5-methylthioadenosine/S-adenosylhomocysteine deaminase
VLTILISLSFGFFALAKPPADLLIVNADVITPDFQSVKAGEVAVHNGLILEVGAGLSGKYQAKRVIDAGGGILSPGFINTHTHLASGYLRGIYGNKNLGEWWFKEVWPLEREFLNPDNVYAAAVLGVADQLRTGVTAVNDMSFCAAGVVKAVYEIGVRARIGETLIDGSNPCNKGLGSVAELQRLIAGKERIAMSIAPHGVHNLSGQAFDDAVKYAREHALPMHIHLGESEIDAKLIKARLNQSISRFLREKKLPAGSVFAHVVHLDRDSLQAIKDSGGIVSLNISSNRNLAVGEPLLQHVFGTGVPLSIGTDGAVTNGGLDYFEEMRAALGYSRVTRSVKSKLDWREIYKGATAGGARALNLPVLSGTIEAGKAADLIILQPPADRRLGFMSDAEFVVKAARSADVKYVVVAGKPLIEDGRFVKEIEELVRLQTEKLKPVLKKLVRRSGA